MSKRNKKHWNDAPIESEQELYELFETAIEDVLSSAALMIGCDSFAHPFSKRLRITNNKRRLGSCKLSKTIRDGVIVDEKFEISISQILFHSYQQTESVIYHEVVHMLPGCFNHGAQFKKAADALNRGIGVSVETTYNAKNHGDINPDGTKVTTFEGENLTLNDIIASFGKTAVIGKKLYSIDGYETRRPKYCIKVTDLAKNREGYITKDVFADAYAHGRIN